MRIFGCILTIFLIISCSESEKPYTDYTCDWKDNIGSVLIRHYPDGTLDYSDNLNAAKGFNVVENRQSLSFSIYNIHRIRYAFQIDFNEKHTFWATTYNQVSNSWNTWSQIGSCRVD